MYSNAAQHLGLTDTSCRHSCTTCTACFVVWQNRRIGNTVTGLSLLSYREHGTGCRHTRKLLQLTDSFRHHSAHPLLPLSFTPGLKITCFANPIPRKFHFFLPDCLHGPLPGPFLLSYSVFDFIFSLFFRFRAVR